jgi:hypothetical protein
MTTAMTRRARASPAGSGRGPCPLLVVDRVVPGRHASTTGRSHADHLVRGAESRVVVMLAVTVP